MWIHQGWCQLISKVNNIFTICNQIILMHHFIIKSGKLKTRVKKVISLNTQPIHTEVTKWVFILFYFRKHMKTFSFRCVQLDMYLYLFFLSLFYHKIFFSIIYLAIQNISNIYESSWVDHTRLDRIFFSWTVYISSIWLAQTTNFIIGKWFHLLHYSQTTMTLVVPLQNSAYYAIAKRTLNYIL